MGPVGFGRREGRSLSRGPSEGRRGRLSERRHHDVPARVGHRSRALARRGSARRSLGRARRARPNPPRGMARRRRGGGRRGGDQVGRAARAIPGESRLRGEIDRTGESGTSQRRREHRARAGSPASDSDGGRDVARAPHRQAAFETARRHRRGSGAGAAACRGAGEPRRARLPLRRLFAEEPRHESREARGPFVTGRAADTGADRRTAARMEAAGRRTGRRRCLPRHSREGRSGDDRPQSAARRPQPHPGHGGRRDADGRGGGHRRGRHDRSCRGLAKPDGARVVPRRCRRGIRWWRWLRSDASGRRSRALERSPRVGDGGRCEERADQDRRRRCAVAAREAGQAPAAGVHPP